MIVNHRDHGEHREKILYLLFRENSVKQKQSEASLHCAHRQVPSILKYRLAIYKTYSHKADAAASPELDEGAERS